jgi:hypothetical protein
VSEQTPQPEQVPETDPAPAVEAAETEASVTEAPESEVAETEASVTEVAEPEVAETEAPRAVAADADARTAHASVPDGPVEAPVEEAPPGAEVPAEEAPAEVAPVEEAPVAPRPAPPTPAMFAARRPAAPRPAPSAAPVSPGTDAGAADLESGAASQLPPAPSTPSESMKHGRVGEDGTVYVVGADGSERAVGSYPDASPEEALAYFARKYDELAAAADLLRARLAGTEVSAHDARQSLAHLKEQIGEAHVVGDLAALEAVVANLEEAVSAKAAQEQKVRAAAKAKAAVEREAIVAEAEQLAATDPARMQWKQSSGRVRELLDEWKAHQRSGPRLDKELEGALWQRFSGARSSFDKARKAWFAQLDDQHAEARRAKERLVTEAETLASSKDWGPTASAFKRLMQDWKRAGRAARADDDALWSRFKAAQDAFFNAKDEVVAAEEAEYAENLKVKEALLAEAEAIVVDLAHLDQAKEQLRRIQDRWDAAGKVPRADIRRVEGRLRAVEQSVRDLEDSQWKRSDPELTARARSMVDQLERQVQGLESDLAAARAAGDERRATSIETEIATKKVWLESARGGLA